MHRIIIILRFSVVKSIAEYRHTFSPPAAENHILMRAAATTRKSMMSAISVERQYLYSGVAALGLNLPACVRCIGRHVHEDFGLLDTVNINDFGSLSI